MTEPMLRKSLRLTHEAKVYFGEVCETFRTYVLENLENSEGKTLKVIDEDLEVANQL